MNNLRIRKIDNLYVVEQQISHKIFFKKWVPFIKWCGINEPFRFSSFDSALNETLIKIKFDLIDKNNN